MRRIVDGRLDGLSVAEIVRELNQQGLTNREGRPFQYRAVASLLRHPLLAGTTPSRPTQMDAAPAHVLTCLSAGALAKAEGLPYDARLR